MEIRAAALLVAVSAANAGATGVPTVKRIANVVAAVAFAAVATATEGPREDETVLTAGAGATDFECVWNATTLTLQQDQVHTTRAENSAAKRIDGNLLLLLIMVVV